MTNAAPPPKPWDHQVRALDFIRDKPPEPCWQWTWEWARRR